MGQAEIASLRQLDPINGCAKLPRPAESELPSGREGLLRARSCGAALPSERGGCSVTRFFDAVAPFPIQKDRPIMPDKTMKIPGPDHPISIEANPSRILVTVGGKVIADTSNALTLREASYPAVQYIPRRDVVMTALTRSEHTTYCPYKGDASYYSIPAGGDRSINAVWTYETPFEAMAQIKNHVAFYPDRVDEIKIS